jgi:hypothetical protein
MMIVFGDFEHTLARHVPSAQHIFEEREDIGGPLWPAE